MNYIFNLGPFISFGRDIRLKTGEMLKRWGAENKVLLVHGKNVKASGLVDDIRACLEAMSYEIVTFDEVTSDAPVEVINKGVDFARSNDVHAVVAIGGGSCLDIAKAIAIMLANDGQLSDYLGVDKFAKRKKDIVFLAIPTTCGTGSEVTDGGVVYFKDLQKKISYWDTFAAPDIALLDPVVLEKLPKKLLAQTALDALAHAVEGYTSKASGPISDALALGAMELIRDNLPAAYSGENAEAYEKLLTASTMAGMAFNRSTVHIGHALAHALGAHTHIHHGAACAFALPFVLASQADVIPDKVRKVCETMKLDVCGKDLAGCAAEGIMNFTKDYGITKLSDFGIQESELETIADATMEERIIHLSPRLVDKELLLAYLKSRI